MGGDRFIPIDNVYVFNDSYDRSSHWVKLHYYATQYGGNKCATQTIGTHGTAVNNTVRQIAGAIGTAVVITIYTVQTTSHAATVMQDTPSTAADVLKSLASILGASDAYYFMTILAIVAFVITLFVPMKAKTVVEEKA